MQHTKRLFYSSDEEMLEVEQDVIYLLEKDCFSRDIDRLIDPIPLGKLSSNFRNNDKVRNYEHLSLRLLLEKYVTTTDLDEEDLESLSEEIEEKFKALRNPIERFCSDKNLSQNKAAGTYLRPTSDKLILLIYSSNNKNLIHLFEKNFTTPPSHFFKRYNVEVPNHILKAENTTTETLTKKLENLDSLRKLEEIVRRFQRGFRGEKKWGQEEEARIAIKDKKYLSKNNCSPKDLMKEANTPYKPKYFSDSDIVKGYVDKQTKDRADRISDRIMEAVNKVPPQNTYKHICDQIYFKSILDDGLQGRENLLESYMLFSPAALDFSDVENGDANSICLGFQEIDPLASGNITLEFDAEKLIKNNPAIFYKQCDLEYMPENIHKVKLGDETISFNYNVRVNHIDRALIYFQLLDKKQNRTERNISAIPKSLLISNNLKDMHKILTLNFFKFIDSMGSDSDNGYMSCSRVELFEKIYGPIEKLNDDELVKFLTDIFNRLTYTAELNFYGAHQIDFSSLSNIKLKYSNFNLNINKFIQNLNDGNSDTLEKAKEMIPELFESYRFLDFLLPKVRHTDIQNSLSMLREKCETPDWIKNKPISVIRCVQKIQDHQSSFDSAIDDLTNFFMKSKHLTNDSRLSLYELKTKLLKSKNKFFKEIDDYMSHENIEKSFKKFESECKVLFEEYENNFKENQTLLKKLNQILKKILGGLTDITVTIVTLGAATYKVSQNSQQKNKFLNTFFRSSLDRVKPIKEAFEAAMTETENELAQQGQPKNMPSITVN